jgi:hypothetical protein
VVDNQVPNHHKETMSTESTLTKTVGSRIRPDVIVQLRHYAVLDGVTPSTWIARLVYAEVQRRHVVASGAE